MTNQKTKRSTTTAILLTASILLASQTMMGSTNTAYAAVGGPVVLMGIDAEDIGHGPQATYDTLGVNIHAQVTNGATGLLVFGCTPAGNDQVTYFWGNVSAAIGEPLTCVETPANIAIQSIPAGSTGFAMIGVASSSPETPFGLTDAENEALLLRQGAIAAHVNAGGGLLGLSQTGLTTPYGYLAGIGAFTTTDLLSYDNIFALPAGTALGLDDSLDVFAWHEVYNTYPAFLNVLAIVDDCIDTFFCDTTDINGLPAAIGGSEVIIDQDGCSHGFYKNNGDKHNADAWVTYVPGTDDDGSFDATFGTDFEIKWSDKGKPQPNTVYSLQQALEANGGNLNALARDGTAALLNAANPNILYPLSEAEVIQKVQDAETAWNAEDFAAFNAILEELSTNNNQVCTVNQAGELIL